jgi:CO/xanthine dehydrogenase Mo-binding subunit
VDRITCVVDCGLVVNSDSARGQVEGGILYGLSSALTGEITLANGRVAQGNFHDYPVARMGDTPRIEVQFVASVRPPTGLGETCVPLVAPALVNAIAAAGLGRRRELPLLRL